MVWITTDVEVDLDCFDDEDIRDEYERRDLGNSAGWDDAEILTKIWVHDREGRKEQAYELMREYVYEKMNKVV